MCTHVHAYMLKINLSYMVHNIQLIHSLIFLGHSNSRSFTSLFLTEELQKMVQCWFRLGLITNETLHNQHTAIIPKPCRDLTFFSSPALPVSVPLRTFRTAP